MKDHLIYNRNNKKYFIVCEQLHDTVEMQFIFLKREREKYSYNPLQNASIEATEISDSI